jgi:hypothetical protein
MWSENRIFAASLGISIGDFAVPFVSSKPKKLIKAKKATRSRCLSKLMNRKVPCSCLRHILKRRRHRIVHYSTERRAEEKKTFMSRCVKQVEFSKRLSINLVEQQSDSKIIKTFRLRNDSILTQMDLRSPRLFFCAFAKEKKVRRIGLSLSPAFDMLKL